MNLHEEMAAAATENARVVSGVQTSQLTAVTPCPDWDLHALLNHTILWTAFSAERRARDEPLPDDLMSRDFVAEPGFAAAYAAQLDSADVGALLLAEMVLHGWDVARASGDDYAVPSNVVTAARAAVDANAELFRKYDGFADPVPVPESASAFDRLLAASGRDPAWAPSGR